MRGSVLALLLAGCASAPPRFQRLYLTGDSADHFWVIMDDMSMARCSQTPTGPLCQKARIAEPDPAPDPLRETHPPARPRQPVTTYPTLPDPRPAD